MVTFGTTRPEIPESAWLCGRAGEGRIMHHKYRQPSPGTAGPCEDFADGKQRYDVILDIGGNPSLSRLRRALAPTGTLVIAGGETGGRWLAGITDRRCRRCLP
jgi:NADPH:quinone reductase-like Zn-dependent oxidoreductase